MLFLLEYQTKPVSLIARGFSSENINTFCWKLVKASQVLQRNCKKKSLKSIEVRRKAVVYYLKY